MIESENLRTASLYINNQLLSRGLLRDGSGIDFARPGNDEAEVAETMSRIMAVRDAEHRESLSATLRALRAESLRQANDIQRLQEKYSDAQRKVGLSEAAEAALRTNLKTSEATVHRLKEEAARTKTLVAQTRASCANEVRKRDRQIESLKRAVTEAGRARGAGRSTGVTSITVVGDTGSEGEHGSPSGDNTEQSYDLRTETNAFLAELAKGLSEENEDLLQLVRKTAEQLKEMSGWDVDCGNPVENGDGHALALAANPADMSLEVDAVLDHLRTILTNPSFVPIEEVVVREDEIHRLRDGWEKMETRWKEAVHLIDGWRKRMQASGRPVNVEELKMGLRLSPVKVNNVEETSHGYALRLAAVLEDEEVDISQSHLDEGPLDLVPHPEADDVDSDTSSMFDHDVDVDDLDVEEPNVEILQQSVMLPSPPLPPPPQLSPLRDSHTAVNRGERPHNRRPPKGFPTIAEEMTREFSEDEPPLPPPHAERPQQSPQKRPILSLRTVPPEEAAKVSLPPSALVSTPDTSVDSIPFNKAADERTSKTSAASARAQKRPAPVTRNREPPKKNETAKKETARKEAVRKETTRKKEGEEPKPTSKPPVKARPTRPPITRGRSETRPDEKPGQQARPPRATSATSATSAKSAATNKSANKSANAEHRMPPPPSPTQPAAPSPAPSPSRSPKRVNSRLPLPRPGCPAPQQSPLTMATITAKLVASERDADAARVRAKLKAARLGKCVSLPPPGTNSSTASTTAPTEPEADGQSGPAMSTRSESDSASATASTSASASDGAPSSTTTRDEDADELGFSPPQKPEQPERRQKQQQQQQQGAETEQKNKSPARKRERRTSKVASRRRSTLNQWELDALMKGGNVTVER
ncbi:Afadin and alpha-actinin-binding-domain-containing protein [Parachaetomium inaequale]|uniref:Afadin and alpha-actinin-binding-domain-containing protein n=1 Tax=Parachaetomium inaequale TaxID=2588326 RepID=A0AAN6PFG8_9PEZI|nr:Afadin and alpha-actinin-binding-domain-containing protein [Parachaetomium inaequale]